MADNHVTGRATISVPGLGTLSSRPGAKLNTGGIKRKEELSDQAVEGFSEELTAPFVECTLVHKKGLSLAAINAIDNVDVSFETSTGTSWLVHGCWSEGAAEISKGEVSVKFVGIDATEVTA